MFSVISCKQFFHVQSCVNCCLKEELYVCFSTHLAQGKKMKYFYGIGKLVFFFLLFTLEFGWFDNGVAWFLRSQMVPKDISAARSKIGPILGSSIWSYTPCKMPRMLCFILFVEGISWIPPDHIGSESSGTSLGVLVLCNGNRFYICQVKKREAREKRVVYGTANMSRLSIFT